MLSLSKEKSINLFILALLPFSLAAVIWALSGITADRIDVGVITVAVLTIFCSVYLRIQLPRVKIHLTISDGLVILAMLLYGGQIALILALIEMAVGSLNLRRQGVTIKAKTILINILI